MRLLRVAALCSLLPLAVAPAIAGPLLNAGSPAPAIKGAAWSVGKPLNAFAAGSLTALTFWSATGDQDMQVLQGLFEMTKRYPKVRFAVVAVQDSAGPEPVRKAAAAAKAAGFTFGQDTTGALAKAWLVAADEQDMPMAFLVGKDGNLAWIGDPRGGLDWALRQSEAGTWNVAQFAKERAKEKADNARYARIMTLVRSGKAREGLADLDKWMASDKEMAKRMVLVRFDILMRADEPAAYKYGRVLLTGELKDQSGLLWLMARSIVDDNPVLKKPDFKLALDLSQRSAEITQFKDANILTALAYSHFKLGNVAKALELQEKAMPIAEANKEIPEQVKATMRQRLQLFRSKKAGK